MCLFFIPHPIYSYEASQRRLAQQPKEMSPMTKIVFLDRSTFPPDFTFTRPSFPHEWEVYDETPATETIAHIGGAEIAITNKVKLPGDVLSAAPNLKMVAIAATGYDHIDLNIAKQRRITVSNIRGYAVDTVPEHVLALIFSLSRSIKGYTADVTNGRWQQEKQFCFFSHPIEDINGKTLLIIGKGSLGDGLAARATAIGMKVIFAARKGENNPAPGYTEFDEALEKADFISIHCPLNEQTRNLIAAPEFSAMKKQPILINTARGGIVNEKDAVTAIETGQIRALGFDTLSSEPPKSDNPLLAIVDRPNVIITPHVAWASRSAIESLWSQLIENIENYKNGTPQNSVY